MAKILVADDNSNVQKTMALALADLGVEVISVNNGEAAVRKLAEVSPDLVLADIFMPVRNGYEVCEYVKKDSRFAHVPVILLVGAFDPLDEREAQRVGADGILKKPFVPPDPLITMVKALLDRSMGERLVAVSASKAPVAVQVKAGGAALREAHVPPPPIPEEPSPEGFPAPAGRVTFGEGDRPVAFGQLFEPPAHTSSTSGTGVVEPVDDEQILTSSRDATLGEPVFWRNDSPDEVEPAAEHSADNQDALSLHKWGEDAEALSQREDATMLRPVEPLEFVSDEEEITSPSHVDSEPVVLDPAAQSPLTVEAGTAKELAANPLDWLATAPAQQPDAPEATIDWDENNQAGLQIEPEIVSGVLQAEPTPFPNPFRPIDAVKPSTISQVVPEPETRNANPPAEKISKQSPLIPVPTTQAPEDTARSVPVSKWAEMTDSLEARASEVVAPHVVPVYVPPPPVPAPAQPISPVAASKPLPPPKLDTSPNLEGASSPAATPRPAETLKPSASLNPAATLPPTGTRSLSAPYNTAESATHAAPPNVSAPVVPDPALVEAVVQRVLDKIRPQVVDIITKEFLRPVVQALVHREIEKQ